MGAFFVCSFSHPIKDGVTLYTDTTPAECAHLENNPERIADEPIHGTYGITGTKYACFFGGKQFLRKHTSFPIFVRKSWSEHGIKEILQNSGNIDPPNREHKDEFISSSDFCLQSFSCWIWELQFTLIFESEKIHFQFCLIEIKYFDRVSLCHAGSLIARSNRMRETVRPRMSSDDENMHKKSSLLVYGEKRKYKKAPTIICESSCIQSGDYFINSGFIRRLGSKSSFGSCGFISSRAWSMISLTTR